jgi:hypothetical protein
MSMKLAAAAAMALTVLAGPVLAGEYHHVVHKSRISRTAPRAVLSLGTDGGQVNGRLADPVTVDAVGRGFEGWPTDYLINRFGDRQMQGKQ